MLLGACLLVTLATANNPFKEGDEVTIVETLYGGWYGRVIGIGDDWVFVRITRGSCVDHLGFHQTYLRHYPDRSTMSADTQRALLKSSQARRDHKVLDLEPKHVNRLEPGCQPGTVLPVVSPLKGARELGIKLINVIRKRGEDLKTITELIDQGADADVHIAVHGFPLLIAADLKDNILLELLLKNDAINVNQSTKWREHCHTGFTALYRSAYLGNDVGVTLLLNAGATVDQPTTDDSTPLYIAVHEGHLGTVELLLEAGAKVDHWKNDGQTLLCIAAYRGHEKVVRLLLEYGARPNGAVMNYVCDSRTGAELNGELSEIVALLEDAIKNPWKYKSTDKWTDADLKKWAEACLPRDGKRGKKQWTNLANLPELKKIKELKEMDKCEVLVAIQKLTRLTRDDLKSTLGIKNKDKVLAALGQLNEPVEKRNFELLNEEPPTARRRMGEPQLLPEPTGTVVVTPAGLAAMILIFLTMCYLLYCLARVWRKRTPQPSDKLNDDEIV